VKRVLLIGGTGQLGTAIRRGWSDCRIEAPSHDELAIERSDELREAIGRFRPDTVVNAAAFHNVDLCEREPERAFAINALAVSRAARIAHDHDVLFVTISTDYVFDGKTEHPYTESDPPHPLSAYGASKLAGEYLVERLHARAFVVRTCGVYGERASTRGDGAFIDRILAQARASQPVRVVADVVASPTFAGDLAGALRALIETEAFGLYHAVNSGPVSWYDFAAEALRAAGVAAAIEPIGADQWKAPATRPRFSALENARLRSLGIAMPSWRDGNAAYIGLRVR
jgi:dTDP-4-dehydrorhamnose reductase